MPPIRELDHNTNELSRGIELIVWREPGDRVWHARVIDGVSRGGVAMAPGDDPWGAVAAALAGYARLTAPAPDDRGRWELHPVPGGARGRGARGREAHHETLGVVSGKGPRAPRSVQSLGTSAKLPPALGNPEWLADLEYVWRMRTHDALQQLDRRAREQRRAARRAGERATAAYDRGDITGGVQQAVERVRLARSAEWAEHRAQAMALPRAEIVATCGKRWRSVRCGCARQEVKVGCDQVQLCPSCARQHWRRWRKRIVRAMDAHVRAARGAWFAARNRGQASGKPPGVYLVTLTIGHSGSIATDRERMAKAWRSLTKVASREGWWGAYALTYEVTPGTTGEGHVHIHLAAVSSWIPYDRLHEVWRELTGAVVLDVSAPRSSRCESAADYLAKYVTKGVQPGVFTGQKAGELLVAFRGKRRVTTSKEFWTPTRDRETRCAKCGEPHRSCGAPGSLRTVAPGAVLQSMAERIGWWIPRGAVQVELVIPSSA